MKIVALASAVVLVSVLLTSGDSTGGEQIKPPRDAKTFTAIIETIPVVVPRHMSGDVRLPGDGQAAQNSRFGEWHQ